MEMISTIGLDIAKNVFQVHGIDGGGKRPPGSICFIKPEQSHQIKIGAIAQRSFPVEISWNLWLLVGLKADPRLCLFRPDQGMKAIIEILDWNLFQNSTSEAGR